MSDVTYRTTVLPMSLSKRILALMASYKLRFAAIDMAVDQKGRWHFFEINPNGQWAWLDLCGATDIGTSLLDAFSKDSHLLEET
jgi:hypothetical protein